MPLLELARWRTNSAHGHFEECVEPERIEDCQAAIDELADLVEQYLGATITVKQLITSESRSAVISA